MIGRLIAYWKSKSIDLPGPFRLWFTIGRHGESVTLRRDRKRRRR